MYCRPHFPDIKVAFAARFGITTHAAFLPANCLVTPSDSRGPPPTHIIIPLIKNSFQLSTTLTSIVQRIYPVYINPQDPSEAPTHIMTTVGGETGGTSYFAILDAGIFSHTHQLSQTTTQHHFAHLPIRISTDTGLAYIVHRQIGRAHV